MISMEPQKLTDALHWRYATKKFDASKTIPPSIWEALEAALVLTPSSFGLQPWRFIVVTHQEVKNALVPVSWGQTQPSECSHHVVFAARTSLGASEVEHYLRRIVEVRGGTLEGLDGFRRMMLKTAEGMDAEAIKKWAAHQAYIALGQFMASAAVLGVDTCPMEGLVPSEYDRILGLEGSGFHTVVACAAGYRSADDKYATLPKVRFPAAELVHYR
jgi:nitroreductase